MSDFIYLSIYPYIIPSKLNPDGQIQIIGDVIIKRNSTQKPPYFRHTVLLIYLRNHTKPIQNHQ